MLDRRHRENRTRDGAKRGSRGDKAEQPLALLRGEDIDDHLPEDGNNEQIEDRGPDEEDASDPDGLLRGRRIQRQCEQQDIGAEERYEIAMNFSRGNVLTSRKMAGSAAAFRQRAGEQPLQIIDATATPIWSRMGRMM